MFSNTNPEKLEFDMRSALSSRPSARTLVGRLMDFYQWLIGTATNGKVRDDKHLIFQESKPDEMRLQENLNEFFCTFGTLPMILLDTGLKYGFVRGAKLSKLRPLTPVSSLIITGSKCSQSGQTDFAAY